MSKYHKRWRMVLAISVPLPAMLLGSGCMNADSGTQYISPAQFNMYTRRCQVAGDPGTDAFTNCLMSFGLNRETAEQVGSQDQFPGN